MPTFSGFEIGQYQFGINGVDIAKGVNVSIHVCDIGVFKTAKRPVEWHLRYECVLKLVPKSFSFGGTTDEPCDIHKLYGCE